MRALIVIVISATGCVTEEEKLTGSCMGNGPQPACIEYTNASSDELELDAEPLCATGTWRLAACTRLTAIGGCTANVNGPRQLHAHHLVLSEVVDRDDGRRDGKCNALGEHCCRALTPARPASC